MSIALALDPWVAAQEAGEGSGAAACAVHRTLQQGLGTTQQVCARSLCSRTVSLLCMCARCKRSFARKAGPYLSLGPWGGQTPQGLCQRKRLVQRVRCTVALRRVSPVCLVSLEAGGSSSDSPASRVSPSASFPLKLVAHFSRSSDCPGSPVPFTAVYTYIGDTRAAAAAAAFAALTCPHQVLHVLRHLPWYTLVRPARLGDLGTLLINLQLYAFCCLVLLLALRPRSGRLWAVWRRRVTHKYGHGPHASVTPTPRRSSDT